MGEQAKLCLNQYNTIPLADGWYLRDSKSNPGRKYYFNPLTKQSFWHITDDEIKALEKKTKDQSNCGISNKPLNPTSFIEGSTSGPKLDNIMHPMVYVNGLPYDPSLWAVPPNPEIISKVILNSSNPLLSSANQTGFVVASNNLQTNILHDTNQTFNRNQFPAKVDNSHLSIRQRTIHNQKHTSTQSNVRDLREELQNRFRPNDQSGSKVNLKRNSFETITWDEDTVKNVLLFLSRKISPSAKRDCWYVVPDVNVVETHSTLLNMMTNLDTINRCRLKIPPFVIRKLKSIAQKPGNESIRRFIRFHCTETILESQQHTENDEILSITDTSKKLIEDSYHVVVFCQETLFKDLRAALSNPVFTIPKMMYFIKSLKLHPSNSNIPQKAKLSSSLNIESKIKNDDEYLSNVIESSTSSTIVCQTPKEESQNALQTSDENDLINTSNESLPHTDIIKIENTTENSGSGKMVSVSNQKIVLSNTPQKRNIRLKRTCDNKTSSDQPTVKRRWNAFSSAKRYKDSVSSGAVQCSKDNENIKGAQADNLCKQDTENYNTPKIEPLEEENCCKVLSSSETNVNAPITGIVCNSRCDVNNKQKENDMLISKTTKVTQPDKSKSSNHIVLKLLSTHETSEVSRFIDVMEHVLLKVSNQDTSFIRKEMPQIQRLRNATIAVIKNYSHCCYVVDAANKLSMKLANLSNKDDINTIEKYFQDADIYLHCMNLIKSLQEINEYNENIQNAKKLLEALLCDIRKPNLNAEDDYKKKLPIDSRQDRDDLVVGITMPDEPSEVSANKKKLEEEAKIQHFIALKLRKVDHSVSNIVSNEDNDVLDGYTNKQGGPWSSQDKSASTESTRNNVEHLETINDDSEYEDDIIEPQDFLNENSDLPKTSTADNEKFKSFLAMFLKEIRETFLVSAQHLEMTLTQENDNKISPSDEFHEVYTLLKKMWESLDSILKREMGDINNNFKSLLLDAGFDINVDQNMCDEYRDVVRKCRDEVKAFINLIESRGIF